MPGPCVTLVQNSSIAEMIQKIFIDSLIAGAKALTANKPAPCEECADKAEIQAVILFPALGTPYIAPVSEKTIKVFMLVEDLCLSLFDITASGRGKEAPLAWYFINKHMRLTTFRDAHKTSANLKAAGLYTSESAAKAGIKVWYHGSYSQGSHSTHHSWGRSICDHEGRTVATLRQSAVDFFVNGKAAYGFIEPAHQLDRKTADVSNRPLPHLFEVELSLQGLRVPPQPDKTFNLAWMVTCAYQRARKPNGKPVFEGVTHWEHQDKLIYDFLSMMRKNKQHFWEPFSFDVPGIQHDKLSSQLHQETSRLKAYHPVMFKTKPSLHIGHLTDVHISSRHFAMAASEAEVIPGISGPLGPKITNSFFALRELFDSMRNKGADALFVTGDLVDFNQNFNPQLLDPSSPKEQWAQYDLSKQFRAGKAANPDLYPRGLDDMLAYSLFKYSYLHDCPVFVITGNHEAYDVPYGIAPRINDYAVSQTIRQTLEDDQRRHRVDQLNAQARQYEQNGNAAKAEQLREQARVLQAETPVIPSRVHEAVVGTDGLADLVNRSRDNLGAASLLPGVRDARRLLSMGADTWTSMKDPKPNTKTDAVDLVYQFSGRRANEGIPADHNLTIYEACMVYGPSYGQVIKSWNFTSANFDWFFMMFTPLADFVVRYGKSQCLIGLDWGETEIMVNADMSAEEVQAAVQQADVDVNGDGSTIPLSVLSPVGAGVATALNTISASLSQLSGLPRADKSISDAQQALIQSALKASSPGCKNVLFSHFTILNYEGSVNFEGKREFVLLDGTFNQYNRGTFSNNRKWLFGLFNGGSADGQLHYTLSGHSHRAGAYAMSKVGSEDKIVSVRAYEPVEPRDDTYDDVHEKMFRGATTRILVSSCGGPQGGQNYKGELKGWNRTAPSGTLLKTDATGCDEFRRIVAKHPSAQPRFCVALDYLVVERKTPVITWELDPKPLRPGMFYMNVGHVLQAKPFVEKVEFFVWTSAQYQANGKSGTFRAFTTTLKRAPDQDQVDKRNKFDEPKFAYQMTIDDHRGLGQAIMGSPGVPIFCRISFNKALVAYGLYAHYNFDDAWCFPVEIHTFIPKTKNMNKVTPTRIERPLGEFGEVPNFLLLSDMLPNFYYYDIRGGRK